MNHVKAFRTGAMSFLAVAALSFARAGYAGEGRGDWGKKMQEKRDACLLKNNVPQADVTTIDGCFAGMVTAIKGASDKKEGWEAGNKSLNACLAGVPSSTLATLISFCRPHGHKWGHHPKDKAE